MEETPAVREVRIQLVTNETMMDQLTTALAGGTPPDLARLKEYRLADLGARGALLPLDRLVAADRAVRLADFTPQSVEGSRVRGTTVPPAQAAPRATTPATTAEMRPLLGLPDSHQLVGLFWNQDIVSHAGLDPASPPARWEDLRHAAQAIAGVSEEANAPAGVATDSGDAAAGKRWGFQFYEFSTREQTYCWFMEWVWRAGGEVWGDFTNQGNALPRVTLDTPAALRALQFQVDLLHSDRTAVPAGTPVPELIANVPQGRVGYWMTTVNAALTYDRTAPGLRFGLGPLPPDQRDAHQLQHNALSIFTASRAPDAAYRLVSFRSREDVQARWSADGAWVPVRPALWDRAPFNQDQRWRQIGALVRRAGNRTKPVVPEWDAFTATVLPPLLAAWRGELAPRQALQEAERAGNTQLTPPAGQARVRTPGLP
jgi:multiple sugar transport system substrate-binding protein